MIPPPPVPIAPSVTPATSLSPSSASPSERTAPKVAIPRLENRKDKVQRQRTLRACVPCRDRKTKCDGHMPVCRQCSLTGSECTWTWSKRERKDWELEAARSKIHAYEALLAEILAKSRADNLHSIEDIFSVRVPELHRRALINDGKLETLSNVPRDLCLAPGVALPPRSASPTRQTGDFSASNAFGFD